MKTNTTCLALLLGLLSYFPAQAAGLNAVAADNSNLASNQTGLFATVLPGNVVYFRAGSFTPTTTWADLSAQTQAGSRAAGVVLDLRSNTSPEDFTGAVRVAALMGQNEAGSNFQQAAYRPVANAPMLIVLTNRETRGAAETLAAALQSRGALVMGEATEGTHAVTPDVATTTNAKDEAVSLALIDRQQVGAVITETAARHRMSESALVKGQDPEQDAFIASHEQAAPAAVTATRDIALVEALDSFKAIRVVEGQTSSPQTRFADSSSTAGQTVIASNGLGR